MSAQFEQVLHGAHDADRTRDLVLTKDVLYQLSYVGTWYLIRRLSGQLAATLTESRDSHPTKPRNVASTLRPNSQANRSDVRDPTPLRRA